ncbi:MAG TPA: hypothetical protein DHV38_12760 [Corynebacterium casei]|uniref:Uncharacterized protein n=1 Tax=Corynebacterium casei UCMA 3821 TaxID=1110505 RepID=G7HV23_9CORY|nr:putative uncharacterized protein [Corynebacterium casei UCMA 3821]HCJ70254.1 hypothetical protein [Corynebacterium casei]
MVTRLKPFNDDGDCDQPDSKGSEVEANWPSGRVGIASIRIATQKNLGIDDKGQTKLTTANDI